MSKEVWELNPEGDVPFKKVEAEADLSEQAPTAEGVLSPEKTSEAAETAKAMDVLAQKVGGDFAAQIVNKPGLLETLAGKVAENKLFVIAAVMGIATIIISGEIDHVIWGADTFIDSLPHHSAPEGGLIRGMEASREMMEYYSRIDGVMGFYDKVQKLENIRVATAITSALAALGGVAQKMGVKVNINKTK